MRELVVPIVPFPTDVGTNAKNGVHPGMLDLLEEPDDVVVPLEVVLQNRQEDAGLFTNTKEFFYWSWDDWCM